MAQTIEKEEKSIATLIKATMPAGVTFKPTQQLYQSIDINQKRFGMILKGKVSPTVDELKRLSTYFKFDISELF